jgi:hypothetical protein
MRTTSSKFAIIVTVLVLMALPTIVCAKKINSSAGTSAFSFLKINVGGRAVGMGSAFTGLADDEAALYYNPAGLVGFEDARFIAEYNSYFSDLQSGFAGYIKPISLDRAFGIQVSYLNYGEFTQTDRSGNIEGTFGGGDLMVAGSFAFRQGYYFSAGATAKFIYEKIQDYSATGVALDLGVRYASDRGRYTGGLMIQNLGTQLSSLGEGESEGLPTTVRIGGSLRPPGLNSIVSSDLIMPFDNDPQISVGAEYFNLDPLFLRLGWNSFGSNYRTDYSDNGIAGMTFGVGLRYHAMQFSYAYSPAADLGDSHRVTLSGGI